MHSTNYTNALILPAEDCAADHATVPNRPGSIAAMQHEMLAAAPYTLASDDVIWAIEAARKPELTDRAAYFSVGRACMRASPLVKSFGWAIHHDNASKVALVDPASDSFNQLQNDPTVTKVNAMRNRRA